MELELAAFVAAVVTVVVEQIAVETHLLRLLQTQVVYFRLELLAATFDYWASKVLRLALLAFEVLLVFLQQDLVHSQRLVAVVVVLAVVVIDQGSSWEPFEGSVVLDSSFRPLLVTVELTFLLAEAMIGNVAGSFRQMVADS